MRQLYNSVVNKGTGLVALSCNSVC